MITPLIGMPMGAEWLVILAIVVLVFGAAKLPDLARGSGQALRIFKAETKGLKNDDDEDEDKNPAPLPQASATPAPSPTPTPTPVTDPAVTPVAQPVVQPVVPPVVTPVVTEGNQADKNLG